MAQDSNTLSMNLARLYNASSANKDQSVSSKDMRSRNQVEWKGASGLQPYEVGTDLDLHCRTLHIESHELWHLEVQEQQLY